MRDKAYKIALTYLAQVESPEDSQPAKNMKKTPDEYKKKELLIKSLEKNYPRIINSFLRQLDFQDLLLASQAVVSRYSDMDTPLKEFESNLSNLKNKFLNTVGEIALKEKDSLVDSLLPEILSQGVISEEIDDFVINILKKIRVESKNALKRSKNLLIQ